MDTPYKLQLHAAVHKLQRDKHAHARMDHQGHMELNNQHLAHHGMVRDGWPITGRLC